MHEGYKHYGCFRIHIASHNRNSTVEILKIVFSEIQKLKDKPLSKADLNKYKQRFIDSIDLAFSANDDDMMNTFGQFIYYDPTFNLKKYKAFINNITPSSLQTEIKRIFDFNSISIISYGKYSQNKINTSAEKTKKLLDKFRKLQDPESNANSNTDLNANSNAD